jgi:hypothetical protein
VQPFSPFNPTAAYSAANVGGAGYFDGTGDSLSIPGNSAFDFGTGNFTAEAWVYVAEGSSDMSIIDFWINGGGSYLTGQWQLCLYTSNTLTFVWASGSSTATRITTPSNTLPRNSWTHVAITRTGNLFQLFTNGVLGASTTLTQAMGTTSSGRIGIQTVNNAAPYSGYIANARILKGTSLYTTTFVPPVLPPTNISNTSLLLNYTNGGIIDATAKNALETVGNAQISTAQSKFGGSSMSFDGSGDYLQAPNTVNANFGSGDFTIEFWMYASSQAIAPIVHQTSYASNQGWIVWNYDGVNTATSTRKLTLMLNGASFTLTTSSDAYTNNTWTHIAVVKNGTGSNNIKIYSNGSQIAAGTYSTALNNATTPFMVGGIINGVSWNGTHYYNGYLNDLRITKGYARYTTDFTPPTQAFPLL